MTVRVERPSRTPGEQLRENLGWALKKGIKWYLLLALGVPLVLGALAVLVDGVASGSPDALFLTAVILGFLFRRRLRLLYARVRGEEPVEATTTESPAAETLALPEPYDEIVYGPEQPIWVGNVIPDHGGDPTTGLWLDTAMRNRHCYVIGKTRTGKTSLLKSLAIQDMVNGRGLAFIDPHGDAAAELVGWVPEDRVDDVVYFDPTDEGAPAFNPFALPYPPPKIAEDIVSVFRMLVGDSWGPRMEHLLRYGVLTLLVDPKPRSLRDLRRLFLDGGFRRDIIGALENEQLREFWELEFPSIPESAVNPILNKLSAFLAPMSHLERVFSQPANDLDFSAILDSGKILLVNLAKGVLGEEPARLLGGLLVTGLQQAALARAARPASERRDCFLYVDEFQNFTVASFESILAESAKYRLNLTLANQNLGQIGSSLQRAIFGNCGTVVAFQVSADDATALRKEMHRTRIVVRPREKSDFYLLTDFVEEQKETYRAALTDKYLGMNVDERDKFRKMQNFANADGLWAAAAQGLVVGTQRKRRREEMERVLARLDGPLEVRALAELFPHYEFRELTFPDPDDFLNCRPGVAFCRVGSADNVCAITFDELPEPDPTHRDSMMAEMAKRFARPPAPESPKPLPRQRNPEPMSFRE